MTTLSIHGVTNTATETQDFDTFTCERITIETKDGQTVKLELFRQKPVAEPVNETELLITSIKGALVRWGLADFPEYERLVTELYHEATKPDNHDVNLGASSFVGCLSWAKADADIEFWISVHKWSDK